jgi:hypothetical protein
MKKSLIVLAIPLAVMAISAFSAAPAQAQTVMANGTVCPAGYTCTPIVKTTTVVCPAGYTCTLKSSNNTTNPSVGTTNDASLLAHITAQLNSNNNNTSTYIPPKYTLPAVSSKYTLPIYNLSTSSPATLSSDGVVLSPGNMTNVSPPPPSASDLPIASSSLAIGNNIAYPFTVDYSKSIADLSQSAGFGNNKVDQNILLGMFPNHGTGTANLIAKQLTITDIIPNYSSGTVVYGKSGTGATRTPATVVTCSQILSGVKAKGYRPLNLQELLSLVSQYPQLLSANNTASRDGVAWGSLVKVTNSPAGVTRNTTTGAFQSATAPATFAPSVSIYNMSSSGQSLSVKRVCGANDVAGAYSVLVVQDSSYTVPVIPTIADRPTATLSGMVVLPSKFSVSVNYDNPDWRADSSVTQYVGAIVNDYNTTGTKNVTIQLVRFYGMSFNNESDFSSIKSLIAAQGYRPAIASEMAALNNQYPGARSFETHTGNSLQQPGASWSFGPFGDGMISIGTISHACPSRPSRPFISYANGHYLLGPWGFTWPANIPILIPVVKI